MPLPYEGVLSAKVTPQSEPIPCSHQVKNSAGGYSFAVDDWARLDRFLILGAECPTYYASEREVKKENAEATLRCIKSDGAHAVAQIVAISQAGRAPKNSPAIFALALAAKHGDEATRAMAYRAMPAVCRTGTHLFEFCSYAGQFGGWSAGLRRAVSRWYLEKQPGALAYQVLKYGQRNGWTHRDLLRLCHAKATGLHNDVLHYAVKGWPDVGEEPHPEEALRQLWATERLKITTQKNQIVALIREYRLPREVVPSAWLKEADVWGALLADMPMTALIRNLGTMSKVGLLKPLSDAEHLVISQLSNIERLRKARVHPIMLLSALKVYEQGHGERSDATWKTCSRVVDALNDAFYASFGLVEGSGKRTLLALDISGSMAWNAIAGVPGLTPRIGSAAMALVTANSEPQWAIVGFTSGDTQKAIAPLNISPKQRLDDVVRYIDSLPFGGTDCALPMLWALKEKVSVETFIIYTDSETWAGAIHPVQALRQYREQTGIPAKLVVVGMDSNGFTIADQTDGGMLDVVGFDVATPNVITDFSR